MQQVKQDKCETNNYTKSKRLTACVNDCSKEKTALLSLTTKLISLGMNFLDPLDQQITDLLFQTNRSKHQTFKY